MPFAVHLPLDRDVAGFQPRDEAGQAGDLKSLKVHRLMQQCIDAVLGLLSQSRQQLSTPVMAGQNTFEQLVRAQEIRTVA